MPNLHFSFLTSQDLPQVRETFLKAFADYVVPVQLSEEQLSDKVEREGIVPELCVGAFAGDQMVGFILTGLGDWQGKRTAYNAGTGVISSFRGQGVTQRMYEFLLPKLRQLEVKQCLLEVIENNYPALNTYRKIGFQITRSLSCFRALRQQLLFSVHLPEGVTIREASQADLQTYKRLCEVEPSWQNSLEALGRSQGQALTLEARTARGELIGYVSFFRKNGAVAQLAVEKSWRGQGVGTSLLREAARRVEVPFVMFLNIDGSAQSMISFLQNRHLGLLLKQYEMLMPVTKV